MYLESTDNRYKPDSIDASAEMIMNVALTWLDLN